MSGMFDKESTITLDPAAPIIVFDTSGPSFLHACFQHSGAAPIDATSRLGSGPSARRHAVRKPPYTLRLVDFDVLEAAHRRASRS